MTVYVCGPDFENILCGIYDAFMGGRERKTCGWN